MISDSKEKLQAKNEPVYLAARVEKRAPKFVKVETNNGSVMGLVWEFLTNLTNSHKANPKTTPLTRNGFLFQWIAVHNLECHNNS